MWGCWIADGRFGTFGPISDRRVGRMMFDIELLAGRLNQATTWLRTQPETRHLPIGAFGARTGAAAAGLARDWFTGHLADATFWPILARLNAL